MTIPKVAFVKSIVIRLILSCLSFRGIVFLGHHHPEPQPYPTLPQHTHAPYTRIFIDILLVHPEIAELI